MRPRLEPLGGRDHHAAPRAAIQRPLWRDRVRHRLCPHREPLLRPCRLAGGGTIDPRCRQAQGHPRHHRARPLRHAVPAALRLGAAQGLAGRRLPLDRGCWPRLHRARHHGPPDPRHRPLCGQDHMTPDHMTKERLYLFDTTLRDGQQTPGIDFSVEDKIAIAALLDAFGVDYVEGGYPGANPTDTAFFSQKRTERAQFVAFGMTKRAGVSASNDPGLAALTQAKADAICFVAKSWDYHVRVALGCTNEENLEAIRASVEAARTAGKEAMVD